MEKIRFQEYEAVRLQTGEPAFTEMMEQALPICHELLGEGLYTEKRLRALCGKENHYFYCVMKEKGMVGIFYCFAEQFGETEFLKQMEVPFLPSDVKVGVAQSIALNAEVRGRGVSKWLLDHGTELLFKGENVEAVLVPAWMKNGRIPAGTHLEKCGYHLLQVVERPWASCEDLRCPACGTVPCSCDGAVYIRMKEV